MQCESSLAGDRRKRCIRTATTKRDVDGVIYAVCEGHKENENFIPTRTPFRYVYRDEIIERRRTGTYD